ncbi:malate:quinone oxidoreductase, partial [Citrobacter freundii]
MAQNDHETVDMLLVGAGIMSATLAVLLKELDPNLKMEVVELQESGAIESSNPWNNAGTGHAGLCELNYT